MILIIAFRSVLSIIMMNYKRIIRIIYYAYNLLRVQFIMRTIYYAYIID